MRKTKQGHSEIMRLFLIGVLIVGWLVAIHGHDPNMLTVMENTNLLGVCVFGYYFKRGDKKK